MDYSYFVLPEDCEVVRDDKSACIMDRDGEKIFDFPPEWTDETAFDALHIANEFYGIGHQHGMETKAGEIRRALFIGGDLAD